MPTNFEFLKEDYPDLFDWAHDMEKKVKQDPNGAINSGSKFFERILNILLENARIPPKETYVEKIAKYYTPAIIIITICVAIIPPLFFGENIVDWIYRALSLMVISCPCAFLISTPIGMVSSITSATRQGVLIKGSSYVEEMRNIKAVIFDKTGTLTEGKLEIMDIDVLDDKYTKDDLIEIASSLEKKSTHPIATAIVNHAKDNNLQIKEVKNFKNIPGKGIVGYINNKQYYAANESLIENSEFIVSRETVINYASDGKTVVFIGNEEKVKYDYEYLMNKSFTMDLYIIVMTALKVLKRSDIKD